MSSGLKADEDVMDHASKHVDAEVAWRRAAWDDDWRNIDEQLNADAREIDMEMVKSELATREAEACAFVSSYRNVGQHYSCAQARSLKPLVKQTGRHLRRRQKHKVEHSKKRKHCCLVDAFRGLGFKVPYARNGPFWVLADGLEMLKLFGYSIRHVDGMCSTGPGRWIACKGKHCFALRRKGEGNLWSIDGTHRRRVFESDLDALVKDAKMFQVPSST